MQTTEELKRAMYGAMENLRLCVIADRVPYVSFPTFEERMERYIGRLQEDLGESIQMLREAGERIRILEEANRAGGDALREIVSERDSLLAAISHQAKRENAQEVPAEKPQRHTSWVDRLRIEYWRKK